MECPKYINTECLNRGALDLKIYGDKKLNDFKFFDDIKKQKFKILCY